MIHIPSNFPSVTTFLFMCLWVFKICFYYLSVTFSPLMYNPPPPNYTLTVRLSNCSPSIQLFMHFNILIAAGKICGLTNKSWKSLCPKPYLQNTPFKM